MESSCTGSMERDQLRIAQKTLFSPSALGGNHFLTRNQNKSCIVGSHLQLREAILGYPEPLWSPRTLSCATLSLCLKISHFTPGFHFLIHRAAYKSGGDGFAKQKDTASSKCLLPSLLSWQASSQSICSASWRSLGLPWLSSSAPWPSAARSSLHPVSLCCCSGYPCSLATVGPQPSFFVVLRASEKKQRPS